MSSSAPDNRCKGLCILGFADVIRSLHQEAGWERVLTALPEMIRSPLTHGGVVGAGWYPLDWYCTLHAAAQQVLDAGPSLARDVGRIATRKDLSTGVYKVFTRFLSPGYVVSSAAKVFGKYYESGSMEIIKASDTSAHAVWKGCLSFDHNIWEDVIGGCVGALEAAGAEKVDMTIISGAKDGDVDATVDAAWR